MQKDEPIKGLRVFSSPRNAHLIEQDETALFNTHFIFNAITAVQNLILQNDRKAALNGLQKLSLYLRQVNQAPNGIIRLDQIEVFLTEYIALQNVRTRNNCTLQKMPLDLPADMAVHRQDIEKILNPLFEQGDVADIEIETTSNLTLHCRLHSNQNQSFQIHWHK